MNYEQFIQAKVQPVPASGIEVDANQINSKLFPFQRDIVIWALHRGKAAIFADCGLGKSIMEWEFLTHVMRHTGKPVLLVAPLGVSIQMQDEAPDFGYALHYCRNQAEADALGTAIIMTNYEMVEHFDASRFAGVALDESSILKSYTGKTKQLLLSKFKQTEFILCATATPSPNDYLELGNHAELLNAVEKSQDMIREYFINDTMKAGGYRLIGHAEDSFWNWVASWAVCLRHPSDIGDYDDTGYQLAGIEWQHHVVGVNHRRAFDEIDSNGQRSLLVTGNSSATSLHREKKHTLSQRMAQAAEIARQRAGLIVLFVETHAEADMLKKLLPEAVEMRGSDSIAEKQRKLRAFKHGEIDIFITKPKMAAHGLNWQHCHEFVVCSVTHKFEQLYQLSKRFNRFGQTHIVKGHMVFAESEQSIIANVGRKMERHEAMQDSMVEAMQRNGMTVANSTIVTRYVESSHMEQGDSWRMWLGDSVITSTYLNRHEVDCSVYSPPFANLYIYSDAMQDMGNSKDHAQFFKHYGYLVDDMTRTHKPGAYSAVHCKDLPLYQNRDDAMGLSDFPGGIVDMYRRRGWSLVDWITIWKDPVIEMQRTKSAGLLWSSAFCERAERARQGMADYVLIFRNGDYPIEFDTGRNAIAPDVIHRCVDLWTNPGERIDTPLHDNDEAVSSFIFVDRIGGDELDDDLICQLQTGRILITRVDLAEMTGDLIAQMAERNMVFHTRVALTDGTWLVGFRKWTPDPADMPVNNHVKHDLLAPGQPFAHEFVGTMPPVHFDSDRDYSIQVWQRYASPVWFDVSPKHEHPSIWMDINQTDVLNARIARDEKDEKHICPLQLGLIARCVQRYSEPGELVYSPFAGIGSEGHEAIKLGRRFAGGELKRSYFNNAVRTLRKLERSQNQPDLLSLLARANSVVEVA